MLGGVNVFISEWQEAMRKYQETTNQEAHNTLLITPRNEKEMIACSQRDSDEMYYIADLPGWLGLTFAIDLIANWVVRIPFNPAWAAAWRAVSEKYTWK